MRELVFNAMECLGVAVTILDPNGVVLYYNQHAAKILDRKPEYIGSEVYAFHKKASSNEKIMSMIHEFRNGRTAPFRYKAKPYGKTVFVTVSPIMEQGIFKGIVHSAILEEEVKSE